MKTPPRPTVRAAGILLMHWQTGEMPSSGSTRAANGEFLLMRHPDRWDLPKGHCEPGESFEQAALRETEEETGIPAASIKLQTEFAFDLRYPVTYPRDPDHVFDKQVRYFLGFVDHKPALRLTEHDSAEWFAWNPPHRIQSQTIDDVLAAVETYLQSNR